MRRFLARRGRLPEEPAVGADPLAAGRPLLARCVMASIQGRITRGHARLATDGDVSRSSKGTGSDPPRGGASLDWRRRCPVLNLERRRRGRKRWRGSH